MIFLPISYTYCNGIIWKLILRLGLGICSAEWPIFMSYAVQLSHAHPQTAPCPESTGQNEYWNNGNAPGLSLPCACSPSSLCLSPGCPGNIPKEQWALSCAWVPSTSLALLSLRGSLQLRGWAPASTSAHLSHGPSPHSCFQALLGGPKANLH